jgi:hypothetical protein
MSVSPLQDWLQYADHPRLHYADQRHTHWKTHRHPRLLFPALGRDGRSAAKADTPMAISSVQGAFRAAKREAGIGKRAVWIHSKRPRNPS